MKGISLPAASSASKHLNVGERNWNYHVLASEHTDVFKGGGGGGGCCGQKYWGKIEEVKGKKGG